MVEVRRRPRLATTSVPDLQSFETKSPQAGFGRESHRASAVAFGPKPADPSPVDISASPPRGRILPSLVPESRYLVRYQKPHQHRQSLAPPSREPKRTSARTSKGKDQASKLPRNSSFSSDKNAPLAERSSTAYRRTSSAQRDDGAGASLRVATTAPRQVARESSSLALRPKANRSDKAAISRDDVRAKPLPNDQRSAMGTELSGPLSSRSDDPSSQTRKRTIMARYVFGAEPKPGERWKRRLLTSR